MKKILGLDLGTTSIGWAFVHEAESDQEKSEVINLGSRVNPLTVDEQINFEKGRPLGSNAERTLKRGARRNLDRYKQRRKNLIEVLKKNGIITNASILCEIGENTTHETLKLRAKSARERVSLEQFARVLLTINKKRGYKSSRKASGEEEGQLIDGMGVAKVLYEQSLTPGQFCFQLLNNGKTKLPDFYRSDLKAEFDRVWACQKSFYPTILDDSLYEELQGKSSKQTWAICKTPFEIDGAKRLTKGGELKKENFKWRTEGLSKQLSLEQVAVVLQEINNNCYNSSGYLGAIGDRSKELYFNKETVGEYLYKQISNNQNTSLKNQVFYRQDYLDEFEQIWETQAGFYPQLTAELKSEIRDVIIFYQRRLKSQKGLISFCEFESEQKTFVIEGKEKVKTTGSRVCPRSSPLFQEFKIWQTLSNLEFKKKGRTKEQYVLSDEQKSILFNELNIGTTLSKKQLLKFFKLNEKEWDVNYSELQGNVTNQVLFEAFEKILVHEGYAINFKKKTAKQKYDELYAIFTTLGIDGSILSFDAEKKGEEFHKQSSYLLWHLLYSYVEDKSTTGMESLKRKLKKNFGFSQEHVSYLTNIAFLDDYGSLSSKAIRKIYPFIKDNTYDKACALAGYNHSKSITKEENEKRVLKDRMELLEKNSLRNPVVEKILNQMVNVVNAIIDDPTMGKPDEIRIELARELKKNAKERAKLTKDINEATGKHEQYRKTLQSDFGILNPSRNDIIRYKLYLELEPNGFKTLYTNQYISPVQLFNGEVDVEHIIPKAKLFDDSFSNKTLEFRKANLDKSELTAYEYVEQYHKDSLEDYVQRVEKLCENDHISKAKCQKLLKTSDKIGEGFIERDLRESQYIAKKAKDMLLELCRTVVSTSGKITDRLRSDWGVIDVLKELNIEKYRTLGLTKIEERKDGQKIEKIVGWTKRNDHRHHAMDALVIAFTKHSYIQYLNNLNARKNESHKEHKVIKAIESKETTKNHDNKRIFIPPMPHFREVAKHHLQNVLISHKAKNKVVTSNKNKIKGSSTVKVELTPRGQLHEATIYGKSKVYQTSEITVGSKLSISQIRMVANASHREALLIRLAEWNGNPKKAFAGKNAPSKKPIFTSSMQELPEKVKLVWLEDRYTIRKEITPDLKIDKVVDKKVQGILRTRLKEFGGKPKEAFVNLDQNPIWQNEEKGIAIKRVTISGVSNVEALHVKKDHLGQLVLDQNGNEQSVDYVSTGNNHHVAIYRNAKGKLQEDVVSFYETVARVNAGVSVINTDTPMRAKENGEEWEFLFTMKQNEMFVFPSEDFNPKELDLIDPNNRGIISRHLFRVQNLATKDYGFRHHLDTTTEKNKVLKNISFKRIRNCSSLEDVVKVRINHLGFVVAVNEEFGSVTKNEKYVKMI